MLSAFPVLSKRFKSHDPFTAFEGSGSSLTQTQTQGSTQSNGGNNSVYQKLVKRVTRFWTDAATEAAFTFVRGVCQKLGYKVETKAAGQVRTFLFDEVGSDWPHSVCFSSSCSSRSPRPTGEARSSSSSALSSPSTVASWSTSG